MTDHSKGEFELVFFGGVPMSYRRWHLTYEAAEQAAKEVLAKMDEDHSMRNAHPAIIYGPGCGPDGKSVF